MEKIFKKIVDFVEDYRLINENDRILASVSGGPDSIFLLHFLIFYSKIKNFEIKVAHINHNLRKESTEELEFVKKLCKKLNLPFYYRNLKIEKTSSIEEEARKKRYSALIEIARYTKCNKIATGHTLDDQAETLLMRLIKGAGIKGIGGISPFIKFKDIEVIRPLLFTEKDEIKKYLDEKKIPYKIDLSNYSLKFLRNKIRHKILPLFEKINPKVKEKIGNLALLLQDSLKIIEESVNEKYEKICKEDGEIKVRKEDFEKLPIPFKRFLISAIVGKFKIDFLSFNGIEEIRKNIEKGKDFVSNKYKIYIYQDGENIIFSKKERKEKKRVVFPLKLFEENKFPYFQIKIQSKICKFSEKIFKNPSTSIIYVDPEKLKGKLYIRNWKKGDYFYPLGMKKRKKISRFFIDKKIPKSERKKIPLLVCDEKIVWVVGYQMSEEFKVDGNCEKVIEFKVEKL